jgi:hypothetical protein
MTFKRHVQNPCSHFRPKTSPLAPVDLSQAQSSPTILRCKLKTLFTPVSRARGHFSLFPVLRALNVPAILCAQLGTLLHCRRICQAKPPSRRWLQARDISCSFRSWVCAVFIRDALRCGRTAVKRDRRCESRRESPERQVESRGNTNGQCGRMAGAKRLSQDLPSRSSFESNRAFRSTFQRFTLLECVLGPNADSRVWRASSAQ